MLIVILGWFGALVILGGYALFSLGKLPNGPLYQLTNLVGALCIALNVGAHGAYPSLVVNGIWAVIAAVVLTRMVRARRRASAGEPAATAEPVAPLALEASRVDELARVEAVERQSVPAPLIDSLPVITAAIAVVALAAAQHDAEQDSAAQVSAVTPVFAPGTADRV